MNRLTDAMRDEHQRRQGDDPRGAKQQQQREREAAAQIPLFERVDELTGVPHFRRKLFHSNAAEIARICVDARRRAGRFVSPPHVVDAIAALA